MEKLRNFFLLGGIAFSLALPQLALSEEAQQQIKIDETQSHDRKIQFTPLHDEAVQAPAISVPVQSNRAVNFKPLNTVKPVVKKSPVSAKTNARPAVKTAQQKHESNVKTAQDKHEAAVKTASHPVETAKPANSASTIQNQQSMLVRYDQDDAPVISASLDRTGKQPKYRVGDKLVVKVKANQDCNVVVFNYDSTGTLTQIFPNDYQQNGFVKAGDDIEIGGEESAFDYQISGKGGPEKVFVYAYPTGSERPLPLTAMAPISGTPFRGTEMTIDQYRDLVNSSRIFNARGIEVKAKKKSQLVSASQPQSSPNKVELGFMVDAR